MVKNHFISNFKDLVQTQIVLFDRSLEPASNHILKIVVKLSTFQHYYFSFYFLHNPKNEVIFLYHKSKYLLLSMNIQKFNSILFFFMVTFLTIFQADN